MEGERARGGQRARGREEEGERGRRGRERESEGGREREGDSEREGVRERERRKTSPGDMKAMWGGRAAGASRHKEIEAWRGEEGRMRY